MSKLLLITGNHPRHLYLAGILSQFHDVVGWVIEDRGEFLQPELNFSGDKSLNELYSHHFKARYLAEKRFFIDDSTININGSNFYSNVSNNIIRCATNDLNSLSIANFINGLCPDIAITYGIHILNNSILNLLPNEKYNIHGGISPWYRGSITHFWPSYMLEPQMTGLTMHRLTAVLDGGPILHQNTGILVRGDGLHELACRTVKSFISELSVVIERIDLKDYLLINQKSPGKLWLSTDWNPNHLRLIYDQFEDKVVDYCLDNNLFKVRKKIIRLLN